MRNPTFKFQQEKRSINTTRVSTPGPGQYNIPSKLSVKSSAVAIVGNEKRFFYEKNFTPGVGTYNYKVPEAPGYVFPKELRSKEKLEILPSPSSYTPIPVQNRAPVAVFP